MFDNSDGEKVLAGSNIEQRVKQDSPWEAGSQLPTAYYGKGLEKYEDDAIHCNKERFCFLKK